MAPLKRIVREQGLWACHLGPELGGAGYGQLKLGLMNEILGRSRFGPTVFGCQAPDTGNAEILARFGTAEQKSRYLAPLLAGEIASSYAMTEPQAGADPAQFTCRARLDGDEWVIDGEKWFASHADFARFLLVVVVTDPKVPIHSGASIIIVHARHARSRGGAQRRGRAVRGHRGGRARLPAVPQLPRSGVEHPRQPGPGIRSRAIAARRRTHPSRHAHGRSAQARPRHDVRARAQPPDQGRAALREAVHAGEDRRLVRPDHAVPAARAVCRVADRQAPGVHARSAPRDRRGEGRDARRCCGTWSTARCTCTARSACRTRCRSWRSGSWCRRWASSMDRRRCTRSPWRRQCCGTAWPHLVFGPASFLPEQIEQARAKLAAAIELDVGNR